MSTVRAGNSPPSASIVQRSPEAIGGTRVIDPVETISPGSNSRPTRRKSSRSQRSEPGAEIPVPHVALHDLEAERAPGNVSVGAQPDDHLGLDPRTQQRPGIDPRFARQRVVVHGCRELRLGRELRSDGGVGEADFVADRQRARRDAQRTDALGDGQRVGLRETRRAAAGRGDEGSLLPGVDEARRDRLAVDRCARKPGVQPLTRASAGLVRGWPSRTPRRRRRSSSARCATRPKSKDRRACRVRACRVRARAPADARGCGSR
jgi:hypothetical protein